MSAFLYLQKPLYYRGENCLKLAFLTSDDLPMKKIYLSFALILLFPVLNGYSQTRDIPVSISVFNNATALPPGVLSSLF
jgi:hypothetical protein